MHRGASQGMTVEPLHHQQHGCAVSGPIRFGLTSTATEVRSSLIAQCSKRYKAAQLKQKQERRAGREKG